MNILYGALAIVASLLISDYFAKSKLGSEKLFVLTFVCQFVFMLVLGLVFYAFSWGFIADLNTVEDFAKRVGGLSAFLGVLVGMRALNKRKRDEIEREQSSI